MSSSYQQEYERLRSRQGNQRENADLSLGDAMSTSPLRQSPQRGPSGGRQSRPMPFTQKQPERRESFGVQRSSKTDKRRAGNSGLRQKQDLDYEPVSNRRPAAPTASALQELLDEVARLQNERDRAQLGATAERDKNTALEEEFVTLRGLIEEAEKPAGSEENAILRQSLNHESELRSAADQDVARLRQQLSESTGTGHRDIKNLKKALEDMQDELDRNLITIYEKGDANLVQMQQLEDLSAIIKQKDTEIDGLKDKIGEVHGHNRELHQHLLDTHAETAELKRDKFTYHDPNDPLQRKTPGQK